MSSVPSPSDHLYDAEILAAVEHWSKAYGVDIPVPLVKAIIAVESGFRPRAERVEPDGRRSLGLMQVLDTTARDLGLVDVTRLFEPRTGIWYGVQYLAKKLHDYGAVSVEAIAAYNAGSARRTRTGELVNSGYVQKVLGALHRFVDVLPAASSWIWPTVLAAGAALIFSRRDPK